MAIKDYEIPGPDEGPEPGSRWKLTFDDSSNYIGHDVEVVMVNPSGCFTPFITRSSAENQVADALEMLSLMYQVRFRNESPLIKIEQRDEPTYWQLIEEEADGKPWFHDIKFYLQN